jgi:hypothetical protein
MKLLFFLMLLPFYASAQDLYKIRQLSEQELLRTYERVMIDACRHSEGFWTNSTFDPGAGHWGTGRSDLMNEGIRAIGEMVFTCGTLLKYSDALSETERRDYLNKSTAALRFAVATHVTGTQRCPDGKPWGNSWQSAMWTGTFGFGAWFIWDNLDASLQKDIERVIGAEADRFLAIKPPGKRWYDSKAEENGWNLICLSLAANMFPRNPHAAAWNEKTIEYAMNTLSTPSDLEDKTLVDGRPVKEWVVAENLHTDFTLENHGFFHPSYVACSSYFLTQTAMHFTYARRPVPQAATHHLMETWGMLQNVILPSGACAFPQGMDWELHGIQIINLFASLGTYQRDPLAAGFEKTCLQYIRAWQTMCDGDLAVPGSRLGFTRHAICAEQAAYGYLAHKLFGPPVKGMSARKQTSHLTGVRRFDSTEFILHRTENKLFSFSWKNRIMGMLAPIGDGNEGNPHFTVPILNGFTGSIELNPVGNTKTKVIEYTTKETPTGFETTGTLLTNGERLKQTIKVCSIGERAVVYQDQVTALSSVSVTRELGVPIGIENDSITGGKRVTYHQDGKMVFDWSKPAPPATVPGPWVNVDGRLGAVVVEGSGINYSQATGYNGQAVYADVLYSSWSDRPKTFNPGEQVTRRIAIFCVEISPTETAALAKSVRIDATPSGQVLRFKLPNGSESTVTLL